MKDISAFESSKSSPKDLLSPQQMLIHRDPKIFMISKKKSKFIKKTEFTKRDPVQKIILK